MVQLVKKTQPDLFPKEQKTKAEKVKEIELKNLKPKISQPYNSSLTSSLNLVKWDIYYLRVYIKYRTEIPGYKSYREYVRHFDIVHKYTQKDFIQIEVFNKVEIKIGLKYSGEPRIVNIEVIKNLGNGFKDEV